MPDIKAPVTVAVIIPTFNTLSWMLEQCFEGVLVQTCPIHQIIVIDDGSQAEETLVCLRRYAAQYPEQFLLKLNPHGGIAKARNAGLELVQSEYVCFLDSDDYWNADFIEKLVECLKPETDIAFCGYQLVSYNGDRSDGCYPSAAILNDPNRFPYFTSGCGFRLYKTEHLNRYHCSFPEGCIMEDEAFSNLAILTAHEVACVESYGYCVRQREDSFGRSRRRFNTSAAQNIPLSYFHKCMALAPEMSLYSGDVVRYRIAGALMISSWVFCCYAPKATRTEMIEKMAAFFREEQLREDNFAEVHDKLLDSLLYYTMLRLYCWTVNHHLEKITTAFAVRLVRLIYKIRGI